MAENAVLITTETERGKREMRSLGILLRVIGLFFVGMALYVRFFPNGSPNDLGTRVLAELGFAAVLFVLSYVLPRFVLRGSWQLDDNGILFTPLRVRNRPRRLDWSDVEAIYWHSIRYRIFRSGRTKLPVNLQWETPQKQDEFEDFLRKKLGRSFNLSDNPVEPLSIRRLLWISAATTFFTLLWGGGLYLQIIYMDQYKLWRGFGILWFMVPLFLLLWSGVTLVRREKRKRWRLRKSAMAGSHSHDAESA